MEQRWRARFARRLAATLQTLAGKPASGLLVLPSALSGWRADEAGPLGTTVEGRRTLAADPGGSGIW